MRASCLMDETRHHQGLRPELITPRPRCEVVPTSALGDAVVLEAQPAPGHAIADVEKGLHPIDINPRLEPRQQLPWREPKT